MNHHVGCSVSARDTGKGASRAGPDSTRTQKQEGGPSLEGGAMKKTGNARPERSSAFIRCTYLLRSKANETVDRYGLVQKQSLRLRGRGDRGGASHRRPTTKCQADNGSDITMQIMEEVKEAMEAVEKWKSCKKVNDGESWKVPELHLTTE
ncbi:hypothetical protein E4U46_002785 [Claviceps purpurea]|nr:hypothetical protein E4U46_002785 [Claviceps purpurea]